MFRKILALIGTLTTFLFLPLSVYASNGFTANNYSFDPGSSTLTFDASNMYAFFSECGVTSVNDPSLINDSNSFYHVYPSNDPGIFQGAGFPINCAMDSGSYRPLLGDTVYIFFLDTPGNYWFSQPITGLTGLPITPIPSTQDQAPFINPLQTNTTHYAGTTFSESGSFNDPDSTSWNATVDFGDGSGIQPLSLNPDNTFTLNHIFPSGGIAHVYTVTVRITDNQGLTGTGTTTVIINSDQGFGASNYIYDANTHTLTLFPSNMYAFFGECGVTSASSGLQINNTNALYHLYDVTHDPGNFEGAGIPVSCVLDTGSYSPKAGETLHIFFLDTPGDYWISQTINDLPAMSSLNATNTLSGTIYNDDNQDGIQNAGENGYQGASITLNTGQTTNTDANGNYSFTNLQPKTYTETLTVPNGYSATTTNPATVPLNADTTQNFGIYSKPHVGTVNVNPNPVQINTSVTATATFTDADTTDTHTAQINWDVQGNTITSNTCQITAEPNGSTPGSVSCTLQNGYTSANIYSTKITVSDNDGASDSNTNSFVSVYAPTASGKFAAGQGYVSPSGTFAQNPAISTGIVQLALSYKYSGTMPAEQKQFMMTFSNNITFSATVINSLVISNGVGTLTGSGTFSNSSTVYNFLVTGSQNNNTIRIQITDPNNNNAVVYDTQPGASNTALPTTPVTGPQGQAGHGTVVAN